MKKDKRKARAHQPHPTNSRSGISRGLRDKEGRQKVEKSFRDSSSTEPRKVGTLSKEKLNLERKKKQVCQAGWQKY